MPPWEIVVPLLVLALALLTLAFYGLVVRPLREISRNSRPVELVEVRRALEPAPELVAFDLVETLGQEQYAALLEQDGQRLERFATLPDLPPARRCRTCQTVAVDVEIHHSIWDGPFHGGGSGRVDVRFLPICPKCEIFTVMLADELAIWPAAGDVIPLLALMLNERHAAGRPIRLPWTDPARSAIALHPALWDRPVFHNLLTRVVKGTPAPPGPAQLPHLYVYYERDQLRHTPPAERPRLPCEVCDQPADAPIHQVGGVQA